MENAAGITLALILLGGFAWFFVHARRTYTAERAEMTPEQRRRADEEDDRAAQGW